MQLTFILKFLFARPVFPKNMLSLSDITIFISIEGIFFIVIIGIIGNLLNLITLLTKDFRTKASVFHLICATVSNQTFIILGSFLRYFTEVNGSNLTNTNRYICKIRSYLMLVLPFICTMCAFSASFDRCVSTSSKNRWRQLSSMRLAWRFCLVNIMFFGTSSSFSLFVFDIYNGRCIPSIGFGSILTNVYTTVCIFFIPIVGISTCGILTWIHLKQSRNRIQTLSLSILQTSKNHRMNRQLLILTFVQAILFTVTYGLRCFTYNYTIATTFDQKSVMRQQIESFILIISLGLIYTSHSITFYLNYILCDGFRTTFHACVRLLTDKCLQLFRFNSL